MAANRLIPLTLAIAIVALARQWMRPRQHILRIQSDQDLIDFGFELGYLIGFEEGMQASPEEAEEFYERVEGHAKQNGTGEGPGMPWFTPSRG